MKEIAGDSFYFFGADYIWPQKMFETGEKIVAAAGGKTAGKEFTPWGRQGFRPRHPPHQGFRRQGAGLRAAGRRWHHLHPPGRGSRPPEGPQGRLPRLRRALPRRLRRGQGAGHVGGAALRQSLSSDPAKKFVADIQKSGGANSPVSQYAFTHYVSLHAAKAAFEKSDAVDGEALVNGLEGISVDGPTGKSRSARIIT